MEITLNTAGLGFSPVNMNTDTTGVVSIEQKSTPKLAAKERIQQHLNHIKEVFLSSEYDDSTMGYIVEDHIIAIQEILDADGF